MRKVRYLYIILILMTTLPLRLSAQKEWVIRGDCTPVDSLSSLLMGGSDSSPKQGRTGGVRRLPSPNTKWDSTKVYRQMVILFSFRDVDFKMENPQAVYDSIFNYNGYNQRLGKGCVAEYFRDQSGGLFNLVFDVYGPVKVDTLACPYTNPDDKTRNYGHDQLSAAAKAVFAQYPDVDYKQYDWNGDGRMEQMMYVYAGFCGNQGNGSYGYIWPNTSSFSTLTTPDGIKVSNYTASGELWKNNASCGFGTICHEFAHSLGLPDIYPTGSDAGYSVCDEWDLMDGGNFTNYGWSPPNFTPTEKMLLGWLTPTELTEPISITNLKPSAEGGEVYQIFHSDSEWLLLENRQQRGWDAGAPGKGLVIYHVNYDGSVWRGNSVNNNVNKRRFELVHADNMDYDAWDIVIGEGNNPYRNKWRMNSALLSTSPYPWTTDSTTFVNDELTDASVPAATMNYPNAEGSMLLDKPITNIRMTEDGLISFDFMGGDHDGIATPHHSSLTSHPSPLTPHQFYNLQGQRAQTPRKGLYILPLNRGNEGVSKKVIIH